MIAARFARKSARSQPTVSDVFEEWVADKRLGSARKAGEPVRERTIKILSQNFDYDIRHRIGDLKISRLTREGLQSCIDAPRRRNAPGAAGHVYRTLRGLVTFAIKRDYITGPDPMRAIENPKPYRPAQVNAATNAEIIDLFKGIDGSKMWAATKLAIEFQLLTGARPTEIRLATWNEVDLSRTRWRIPAVRVKTNRDFSVHLSSAALCLLEKAKAHSAGSTFVFPGASGGAMEKMAVARALSRLSERTKDSAAKKLRPHDLRRTFRTVLSRLGVLPHIAALCLNHQEAETMRRIYDGHNYANETVDAWNLAGQHFSALHKRL